MIVLEVGTNMRGEPVSKLGSSSTKNLKASACLEQVSHVVYCCGLCVWRKVHGIISKEAIEMSPSLVSVSMLSSLALLLLKGSRATTLVAARFHGGVVIGADSRTSQGSFVANRLTDKIASVYPGIFLARSGSSAGE